MTAPEWFTRATTAPVTQGLASVSGVPLAYRGWGRPSRHDVVLIHGTAAHAHWWDHIAPLVAATTGRVLAVDLSGHGDSGWRPGYDIDVWADDILGLVDQVADARQVTLVGHSLGGLVALRAGARDHPRVSRIVVVDARIRDQTPDEVEDFARRAGRPTRIFSSRNDAVAAVRLMPISEQACGFVVRHIAEHSVRDAHAGAWTWKFDPLIFAHSIPGDELLSPLSVPVTQLRAEGSRDTHRLQSDGLGAVVEVPASGHHIMVDEPIALATALRCVLSAERTDSPTPHRY